MLDLYCHYQSRNHKYLVLLLFLIIGAGGIFDNGFGRADWCLLHPTVTTGAAAAGFLDQDGHFHLDPEERHSAPDCMEKWRRRRWKPQSVCVVAVCWSTWKDLPPARCVQEDSRKSTSSHDLTAVSSTVPNKNVSWNFHLKAPQN